MLSATLSDGVLFMCARKRDKRIVLTSCQVLPIDCITLKYHMWFLLCRSSQWILGRTLCWCHCALRSVCLGGAPLGLLHNIIPFPGESSHVRSLLFQKYILI